MIDREKVIKGVTRCGERNWRNSCLDCPYENVYGDRIRCAGELSRDVLALLKQQEEQKQRWLQAIADNQLANSPNGNEDDMELKYESGVWNGLQMAWEILTEDETNFTKGANGNGNKRGMQNCERNVG